MMYSGDQQVTVKSFEHISENVIYDHVILLHMARLCQPILFSAVFIIPEHIFFIL